MAHLSQVLDLEEAQSSHGNAPSTCLEIFLKTLRSYFVKCLEAKSDFVTAARSSLLLSQVLASLLVVQPLSLVASLERLLCLSLLDFAYAGRLLKGLCHILDECLLPSLLLVRDDTIRLKAFGQDLQVR